LVSFVTKITEREDEIMRDVRREIAILTIENIEFNKFSSSDLMVDNNKLRIQTI